MSNTRLWMVRFMRLRSPDTSKVNTRCFLLWYWQTLLFLISHYSIECKGLHVDPEEFFSERGFACIKVAALHVLSRFEQRPLETWVPSLFKKCSVFNANYCRIPKFQPLVDIPSHLNPVTIIYIRYALILYSLLSLSFLNPLNAELNPICYLLALLVHHFLHVSRISVKSLTLRLLMSFIYGEHILDVSRSHTTKHHSR